MNELEILVGVYYKKFMLGLFFFSVRCTPLCILPGYDTVVMDFAARALLPRIKTIIYT